MPTLSPTWQKGVVGAVLLFALLFSLRGLSTYPGFWFDEALNIEQARNLSEQGFLNLSVAPGVPYQKPYHLTTGYPVVAPLSLLFSVFGFDFGMARLYMIGWLLLFLFSSYLLAKEYLGEKLALYSLIFLATFAPVYGNGETVIAEVPALALLFLGTLCLKRAENRLGRIFLAGLLLGLCVAIKPLYLLLAPALALSALLSWKSFSWKREAVLALGVVLPLLLYVYTVFPGGGGESGSILSFWQSRTAQGALFHNLAQNLPRMLGESSLLYTLLISIVLGVALPWKKVIRGGEDRTLLLLGVYGSLIFLFFLQSIGWNRYLLFYQAIALLFFPYAFFKVAERFWLHPSSGRFARYALFGLMLMQTIHLFFFATIFPSTAAPEISAFLKENTPSGSIYVVNSAEAAAFIPTDRLYQYFDFFEKTPATPNRLLGLETEKFDYIIGKAEDPLISAEEAAITTYYEKAGEVRGLTLFKRKP